MAPREEAVPRAANEVPCQGTGAGYRGKGILNGLLKIVVTRAESGPPLRLALPSERLTGSKMLNARTLARPRPRAYNRDPLRLLLNRPYQGWRSRFAATRGVGPLRGPRPGLV